VFCFTFRDDPLGWLRHFNAKKMLFFKCFKRTALQIKSDDLRSLDSRSTRHSRYLSPGVAPEQANSLVIILDAEDLLVVVNCERYAVQTLLANGAREAGGMERLASSS